MRVIPAIPLLVLLASSAHATTLCVSPAAPGPTHDGNTWATAYPSVTTALAGAQPGDEVWVSAETYKENITLPSGVALYGGFLGTETSREQRDPVKNVTILDGQWNGTVVTIPKDATSQTVLDGFTVQNGYGLNTTGSGGTGGGVYIAGGTPILTRNTIVHNQAQAAQRTPSYGGGLYIAGGMPLIQGNTISYNFATHGGGLNARGGLIRDNLISNNTGSHSYLVEGTGGGIEMRPGTVVIHNLITGNEASDPYGGGAGVYGTGGVLLDNTISENIGWHGAALQNAYSAIEREKGAMTVVRNTFQKINSLSYAPTQVEFGVGLFADNLLLVYGGIIGLQLGPAAATTSAVIATGNTIVQVGPVDPAGHKCGIEGEFGNAERPVVSNNIITGWDFAATTYESGYGTPPTFTVDHNDSYGNGDNTLALRGGSPIGENGNISVDPLFVSPSTGDYHLKAGSPCIDAGNDAYVNPQDRDFDGAPRIAGAHVDIGAYEYGSPLYTVQDAATVLRIAAGISLSTPADLSRLDVAGETGLTVTDATRIAQWLLN